LQVREFAKERGFRVWAVHEKHTGWRAWYAGMELPENHKKQVSRGILTATEVAL
jgi:hypothetical protein